MNDSDYVYIIENSLPAVLAGNFYLFFGSDKLDEFMRMHTTYLSLPKDIKPNYIESLIDHIKKIHIKLNIPIDKLKREIFLINEQVFIIDRDLTLPVPEIIDTNNQRFVVFKERKTGIKENWNDNTKTIVNVYFQKNALSLIKFSENERLITIVKDGIPYIGFTNDEKISYKLARVGDSYSSNLSLDTQSKIVCGKYVVDNTTTFIGEKDIKFYKLTLTLNEKGK